VTEWAVKYNFGPPVGINGFESKWDEYVDQLHDKLGFMPPAEYQVIIPIFFSSSSSSSSSSFTQFLSISYFFFFLINYLNQ
jgi:hypothetical protein